MDNVNMNELMKLLSKMDKKDLEKGLSQASQFFNSPNAENIIKEMKKNQNNK